MAVAGPGEEILLGDTGHPRGPPKTTGNPPAGCGRKRSGLFTIVNQGADGPGNRRRVLRRNRDSGFAVTDNVRDPAHPGSNDGDTCGHGLEHNQPERFIPEGTRTGRSRDKPPRLPPHGRRTEKFADPHGPGFFIRDSRSGPLPTIRKITSGCSCRMAGAASSR